MDETVLKPNSFSSLSYCSCDELQAFMQDNPDFDINSKDDFERTILSYVNQKDKADWLISHGANVFVKGSMNKTLLHYCASIDDVEMLGFYLDKGLSFRAVDESGKTPLLDTAELGFSDSLKLLIGKGASPFDRDNQGNNALHLSALRSQLEYGRILLEEQGLDVNQQNHRGETALHISLSGMADYRYVLFLLDHGADPLIKDNNGNTPLDVFLKTFESQGESQGFSKRFEDEEIVDLLKKRMEEASESQEKGGFSIYDIRDARKKNSSIHLLSDHQAQQGAVGSQEEMEAHFNAQNDETKSLIQRATMAGYNIAVNGVVYPKQNNDNQNNKVFIPINQMTGIER